jgi:demethylmenaquinone methyltransferase / 2-methoxy-6-polyprenyl-1,4-benzoquinol methylase
VNNPPRVKDALEVFARHHVVRIFFGGVAARIGATLPPTRSGYHSCSSGRSPDGHSAVTDQTHFGFETVPVADKARRVRAVFDSVAPSYDLMNDLMSGGLHRLWKRFALDRTGLRPGDAALDVAGGTGDLSIGMARQVGDSGLVMHTDINHDMLDVGRGRIVDAGVATRVQSLQADAEALPFADGRFHAVTIGFGLRNVTDKDAALRELTRVLRPGGRLLVLEFSRPVLPLLAPLYDQYSFRVLPVLGDLVAGDAASYRYLAESIRKHPDQETLAGMMTAAGLEDVTHHNLAGGIVALHLGFRY